MNKLFAFILTISTISLLTISCKDQMTYADHLREESKAIERFILKNDISVIEKFPANGVFGSKEFYKDPGTGLYYNIVEYGDTTGSLTLNEDIYIRFRGLKYFMVDDSTSYNNMDPSSSPWPQVIKYLGPVNSATQSYYDTPGWAVPLSHVGHNGVVKMIVPFNMGSASDRSQYQPTYYDYLYYRFSSKID